MSGILKKLSQKSNIDTLGIEIHWSDFFRRENIFNGLVIEERELRGYENGFVEALQKHVHAKRITQTPAENGPVSRPDEFLNSG